MRVWRRGDRRFFRWGGGIIFSITCEGVSVRGWVAGTAIEVVGGLDGEESKRLKESGDG